MSDEPIRLNITVQPHVTPINVILRPPIQLNVEVKQALTPLIVKVGGPYAIVASAPEPGSGSAPTFMHVQSIPADEWSVTHSFGSVPIGYLVMAGGVPIIPDFKEFSAVRVVLAFGYAETGSVTLLKGN